MNKKPPSLSSIEDLRRRVREVLPEYGDVLVNLMDSLAAGPRIVAASEVALSPLCVFALSTLYTAIRTASGTARSGSRQAREITRLLKRIRRVRLAWLDAWLDRLGVPATDLGEWRVRVLDATNFPRPKSPTLERGYVHGVDGMRPGHALSVLAERVADGSWTLPLEIEVVPVGQAPAAFGATQLAGFIAQHGWDPEDILAIDAGYTNAPTLKPMVATGANLLGRLSGRRVLFEPPPPYSGRGRPPIRGRKIQLWDGRTLPKTASCDEQVQVGDGRRFCITAWDDVRMRQWPERALTLYRVIEYRANGTRRFKKPLWLIYVGTAAAPLPAQARAIYGARFSIEHAFRFLKGELGLVSAQFNGPGASDRVRLWVEMVATSMWELFAMREQARPAPERRSAPEAKAPQAQPVPAAPEATQPSPQPTPTPHVTPGAVRKQVLAIFLRLGIERPTPLSRGKSPGRATGTRFLPRKRHWIFRKRKPMRAA